MQLKDFEKAREIMVKIDRINVLISDCKRLYDTLESTEYDDDMVYITVSNGTGTTRSTCVDRQMVHSMIDAEIQRLQALKNELESNFSNL